MTFQSKLKVSLAVLALFPLVVGGLCFYLIQDMQRYNMAAHREIMSRLQSLLDVREEIILEELNGEYETAVSAITQKTTAMVVLSTAACLLVFIVTGATVCRGVAETADQAPGQAKSPEKSTGC